MDAVVESVRSLWIPLDGVAVLVPNVAIAEVFEPEALLDVEGGPEWLSGAVRWRGQDIPVVSMQALCGFDSHRGAGKARICIINSLHADSGLPFYAMIAAAIPRLLVYQAFVLLMMNPPDGASRSSSRIPTFPASSRSWPKDRKP